MRPSPRTRRPPLVGLGLCLGLAAAAALVAARGAEPTAPAPAPAAPMAPAEPPPPASPEPPPPPAPGPPGPAYLMLTGGPVIRVDAAGFTPLPSPEPLLYPAAPAPGAAPHLSSLSERIYAVEGEGLREIARLGGEHLCVRALLAGPAALRVVCDDGVHAWEGGAWSVAPAPPRRDESFAGRLPVGAVFDGEGALWVASRGVLWRQEAAGWRSVAGAEAMGELLDLAPGPGAEVLVLAGGGLFALSAAAPEPRPIDLGLGDGAVPHALEVSARGDVAVSARAPAADPGEASLPGFDVDGGLEWLVALRGADGRLARWALADEVLVGSPSALAVDGRGRVWWGSAHGVAILAPGAPPVRWWRGAIPGANVAIRDDFDRYNGRGGVGALLVVDGGPELPAVAGDTPTRAQGRLRRGRRPLAGVALEVCPAPRHRFRGSPCAHAPDRRAATTDADGRFTVDGLHPGEHRLLARLEGGWREVDALVVVAGVDVPEVALGDVEPRP